MQFGRLGGWWWLAGILALGCLVYGTYAPSLHTPFIWDDELFLRANPSILAADGLKDIWFSTKLTDYWPITYSAFWLQWRLWGPDPTGYHVVNTLCHFACGVLVWDLLRRLKLPGAWLVAALFLLHPVNVEAVAWIAQLKTLIAAFFCLATLLFLLRFEKDGRFTGYVLALLTFAASLMAKTAAVMLPLVILAYLWLRYRRLSFQTLLAVLPFGLVSLVFGVVGMVFHRIHPPNDVPFAEIAAGTRLARACHILGHYMATAFVPAKLSLIYNLWPIQASPWTASLEALVPLAILALLVARRGSGSLYLLYALMMLVPVLGFLDIAYLRISDVADHWQYLAVPGFLALGVQQASRLLPKLVLWFLALATLGGAATLGHRRAVIFGDPVRLWQDALLTVPDSYVAHLNLGQALFDANRSDEGLHEYAETLRLNPGYWIPHTARDHERLASLAEHEKEPERALAELKAALLVEPENPETLAHLGSVELNQSLEQEAAASYSAVLLHLDKAPPDKVAALRAQAYSGLGILAVRQKRFAEALPILNLATRDRPGDAPLLYNRGLAALSLGDLDQAASSFAAALKVDPKLVDAITDLGVIAWKRANMDGAIAQFQAALVVDPRFTRAAYNLGVVLRDAGRVKESVAIFEALLRQEPGLAAAQAGLADSLAKLGGAKAP